MAVRTAEAEWRGTLKEGTGSFKSETGSVSGKYSFSSRFEEGPGTNPEELIGAAHAGCFAMALSLYLGKAGFKPDYVDATAYVTIMHKGGDFKITSSRLVCEAKVPGIDQTTFVRHAESAKANCPISKALAGAEITLEATLAV